MRIRLVLRALVAITALVVVWLVASPALAFVRPVSMHPPADTSAPATSRAPLCDPRGATTFAPPPQMQDVELSLDTGLTLDDCMTTSRGGATRAAPGRAPLPSHSTSSTDSAVRTLTALVLGPAVRARLPVPAASTPCPRSGVRSTVDRPPRA